MTSRLAIIVIAACSSAPPPATQPTKPAVTSVPPVAPPQPGVRAPEPPVAAKRPHDVKSPHGTRVDPYYWLRDDTRKNPEVLGYLEAENAYAKAMLAPAQKIEDALFAEARARVDEEESSAPVLEDGYWYYSRYEKGKQHPIYARRKGTMDAAEEVLLDGNALATTTFYAIGDYAVSRDGKLLAWADDTVGRNQFALHVKNLATGEVLADTAANIAPSLEWANDNKTLFYVGKDADTLREDRVYRHALGGAHELVYQEKDAAYYVDIGVTKSHRYITIEMDATETSETRLVDADKPASAPTVFLARDEKAEHSYSIDHVGGPSGARFVMRTNMDADNYRIVEVKPGKQRDKRAWKDIVPHRKDVFVEDFAAYTNAIAVGVRMEGQLRVQVLPAKKAAFYVEANDAAYAMSVIDTPDVDATNVRYSYDSLTSPHAVWQVDVATGKRTLLKQEAAPTYDASLYTSEYRSVPTNDGQLVPMSIVYKKTTKRDGTAPLLVYGYGAYGASIDPHFDRLRVSLLDRGWVYAMAHVRGGQERGYDWYENGRVLHKLHTFEDFIAVTEYLVKSKFAAPDRVFAEGGSAGGLLVAAVATMRADLYRGMIVWVPFVDVVTTMLDESIPLVTNEYDEWGDPRDKAAHDYMLAYSPYDNVSAKPYPALYVRTGLWDSQVQYYEPAKWVAKLRAMKTDKNLLVFETDMKAGHSGTSGRYDAIRESARAYAFLLHVLER